METSSRHVIVTGANRGLGYGLVEMILEKQPSVTVIVTARESAKGEEAVKALQAKYPRGKLVFHQLDLGSTKSIEDFVDWIVKTHCTIDILFNNAGVSAKDSKLPPDALPDASIIDSVFDTNLRGVISLTEKLLPYFTADGKIVNVSSIRASLASQGPKAREALENPENTTERILELAQAYIDGVKSGKIENIGDYKNSSYGTSKAMLNAWTRFGLTKKLKPGQLCMALHPGWCQTDMGSTAAPRTISQGAEVSYFAGFETPWGIAGAEYNGKFINEDKTICAWDIANP